ncbi:MAG: hypothetical protein IPJ77_19250 [Planctomycetes bacterium]|nr:hypothetical protein [Planctomycetota bacterium]
MCLNRDQYHSYGGPGGSAGYWSWVAGELVLYDARKEGGKGDTWAVLNHEAFHQYIFYFYGNISPHSWYNEGTGDFYSGYQYKHGQFKPRKFEWRTDTIKDAIKKGWAHPLEKFVRWSQEEYYSESRVLDKEGKEGDIPNVSMCYAQGWSFIYFLRTGKKANAKGWDPRWDTILETYLKELAMTGDTRAGRPARPSMASTSTRSRIRGRRTRNDRRASRSGNSFLGRLLTQRPRSPAFALAVALAPTALADRLITKDGRVLTCKKARAEGTGYRLVFENGEILVPDKAQIASVEIEGDMSDYVPANEDEKKKLADGFVRYQGKWLSKAASSPSSSELRGRASSGRGDRRALGLRPGWRKRPAHFRVKSNTSPELLNYYGELLEAYYDLQDQRIGINPTPTMKRTKMQVNVYRRPRGLPQARAVRQDGASPSVLGFFSPLGENLNFYHDYEDPAQSTWVALHECTHLLTYLIDQDYDPQIWVNEGVADYFGSSKVERDKKGKLVITPGELQTDRVLTVQQAIKEGATSTGGGDPGAKRSKGVEGQPDIKLEKLFMIPRDEFDGFQYAHAWSFVYFLNNFENGKYQKAFDKFFKGLYTLEKGIPFEAVAYATKTGGQTQPENIRAYLLKRLGLKDTGELEKEWRRFIAEISDRGPRGAAQARAVEFLIVGATSRTRSRTWTRRSTASHPIRARLRGRARVYRARSKENFEAARTTRRRRRARPLNATYRHVSPRHDRRAELEGPRRRRAGDKGERRRRQGGKPGSQGRARAGERPLPEVVPGNSSNHATSPCVPPHARRSPRCSPLAARPGLRRDLDAPEPDARAAHERRTKSSASRRTTASSSSAAPPRRARSRSRAAPATDRTSSRRSSSRSARASAPPRRRSDSAGAADLLGSRRRAGSCSSSAWTAPSRGKNGSRVETDPRVLGLIATIPAGSRGRADQIGAGVYLVSDDDEDETDQKRLVGLYAGQVRLSTRDGDKVSSPSRARRTCGASSRTAATSCKRSAGSTARTSSDRCNERHQR